jgi:two-component sensor histidine kinase
MQSANLGSFANPPSSGGGLRYPGVGKLFLIWTAIGILTSFRYQAQRPASAAVGDLAFVVAFTACYYPWIALTPMVFQIERRFPLGAGRWSRNLILLALASIPVCLVAAPLMSLLFAGVLSVLEPAWAVPFTSAFGLRHFPMAQALFWCSVGGGYFVRTQFQLRQQEQQAAQLALEKSRLEAGLKQAQLDVLRARLNPHFLFNSLQNISVMTRQDPQTASRMLARLGDLLRAVLRNDSQPESTLREEIELTRAYVALEQLRFGDRLEVKFDIYPATQQAMVPSFVLQPLVENAITHGLRGAQQPGRIGISSSIEDGNLVLEITDNGVGPPNTDLAEIKMGVGLGSTLDRLANLYPNRHDLSMQKLPEGGTKVHIELPLHHNTGEDQPFPDEQPAIADR